MQLGEEGAEVNWSFTSTRAPVGGECFQGMEAGSGMLPLLSQVCCSNVHPDAVVNRQTQYVQRGAQVSKEPEKPQKMVQSSDTKI